MKKNLFVFLFALLISTVSFAQQGKVTGTVSADDGSPLPGASVMIKGTATGVTTDLDGKYTIEISGTENPVLVYSYVGYLSEEVTVGNQVVIDITLVTDVQSLDEVVVVGYGVQKKSLVTGAISKLDSEELVSTQPQRVEQAIQGKVSGVTVASESGSPGAGLTIKIRGTSSNRNSNPLFIVDGMKTGGIDYLDPADIESIEILKDAASAAIYGAEGGNGVVLITTKKGKSGSAQLTYNMYYGIQQYIDKFEMMDADQYIDYYQKALLYEEGTEAKANKELVKKGLPEIGAPYSGPKTNWIDEITDNAPVMNHNIGISGGSDKSTYSASANYYDQQGITGGEKSQFNRWTFRLNSDYKATSYLTVGIKATYSHRERSSLNENSEFGGTYTNAVLFDPLVPVLYNSDSEIPSAYDDRFDKDGNPNPSNLIINYPIFPRNEDGQVYGLSTRTTNELINPAAQIELANGSRKEDKVLAGAYVEIEPIKGLKLKSSYDVDVANGFNEYFVRKSFINSVNRNTLNHAHQERDLWTTWFFDNTLLYSKTIGEHSFSALVGSHAEEYNHDQLTGMGYDMLKEEYPYSHPGSTQNLPTEDDIDVSGTQNGNDFDTTIIILRDYTMSEGVGGFRDEPRKLASVFGRITYNYGEKYLFNFTIRNDKSSMLSPKENPETGRPYYSGIFPSLSLGWVISKESFWNLPAVNFLKARYSYGENGSLGAIVPFFYVPVISYADYVYSDATGTSISGAAPRSLSNDALSWESTIMNNYGLDFRLLDSRITGSVEYYVKTTEGLLDLLNISAITGSAQPWGNRGTVQNKGIEFELGYNKSVGEFKFDISGNISYQTNKVTYFESPDGGANLGVGGSITRIEEGQPIFYIYGYETEGIWRDQAQIDAENYFTDTSGARVEIQNNAMPGDIRIVDVNNDSTINIDDKTNIGNPHPKVLAGLNFSAEFKGFELSANLTGAFGQKVYMGIYRDDIGYTNHPAYWYEEAWSPENPDASFFRPTLDSDWNLAHNDMMVENGGYVKLRNITLAYTLPSALTKKMQIANLKIYVAANNVTTFTKYRGIEPEMGNTSGIASYGIDRGFYPPARQIIGGINVTF